MNRVVAALTRCFNPPPIPSGPQKLAQIPDLSNQFIFIEQHPDDIEFITFTVEEDTGPDALIGSYPAAYHDRGSNLSFADGHVEYHQWQDVRTLPPVKYDATWLGQTDSPNNPDVQWLQQHTVSERQY